MVGFRTFTSESVSDGHPDKVADQLSDAILDALLEQDPHSRVACETLVKTGLVVLAGELRTQAVIDHESIVRDVIAKIGYTDQDSGFSARSCGVLNVLGKQSHDIAIGVDKRRKKAIGAGDQGMMFGFACKDTASYMPAAIHYAHALMARQKKVREKYDFLRPDAKAQVTFTYDKNNSPNKIDAVVLSTQHTKDVKKTQLQEAVMEEIIKPTLPAKFLHKKTVYHINPTGQFVIGGPASDCGLTGRKIIVDTYGGYAHHGGGAFSGKDATKVDRSSAYACRYIAKNIVAAGLATICELQVSYAIGIAEPTSVSVNTFGSGKIPDSEINSHIHDIFDLTPAGIIHMLELNKPIYQKTATFGHFGRKQFRWEQTDKSEQLQALL